MDSYASQSDSEKKKEKKEKEKKKEIKDSLLLTWNKEDYRTAIGFLYLQRKEKK